MLKRNQDLKSGLSASGRMLLATILAVPLAWAALEAGERVLARVEPDSEGAYRYFRQDYARAVEAGDATAFLRGYRLRLMERNGGYTPARVDAFLCQKLRQAPGPEAQPVAGFYAAQAGGREGLRILRLPAPIRERVVGLLMRRLDGFEPQEAQGAFVLIEELRQGQVLFKGSIGPRHGVAPRDWSTWWRRDGLPRARRAFEAWWRRDEPWALKSRRDPLAGSGLEAFGL